MPRIPNPEVLKSYIQQGFKETLKGGELKEPSSFVQKQVYEGKEVLDEDQLYTVFKRLVEDPYNPEVTLNTLFLKGVGSGETKELERQYFINGVMKQLEEYGVKPSTNFSLRKLEYENSLFMNRLMQEYEEKLNPQSLEKVREEFRSLSPNTWVPIQSVLKVLDLPMEYGKVDYILQRFKEGGWKVLDREVGGFKTFLVSPFNNLEEFLQFANQTTNPKLEALIGALKMAEKVEGVNKEDLGKVWDYISSDPKFLQLIDKVTQKSRVFSKEQLEMFKDMEDVLGKGKYKYRIVDEGVFPSDISRPGMIYYQVIDNSPEWNKVLRVIQAFERQGSIPGYHEYHATDIPVLGWIRVQKIPETGVWVVHTVQTDHPINLRGAKEVLQNYFAFREKVFPRIEGVLKDWAKLIERGRDWPLSGVATVLRDARKEGVPFVLYYPSEVQYLRWTSDRQLNEFYNKVAERLGFKKFSYEELPEIIKSNLGEYTYQVRKAGWVYGRIPLIFISAGMAGMLGLSRPKEAEASKLEFRPLTKEVLEQARGLSSSIDILSGKQIGGKEVLTVLKGPRPGQRLVIFKDNTYIEASPKELHILSGEMGRKEYREAFKNVEPKSKVVSNFKSLVEAMLKARFEKGQISQEVVKDLKGVVKELTQMYMAQRGWERELKSVPKEYTPTLEGIQDWLKKTSETLKKFQVKLSDNLVQVDFGGKKFITFEEYANILSKNFNEFADLIKKELGVTLSPWGIKIERKLLDEEVRELVSRDIERAKARKKGIEGTVLKWLFPIQRYLREQINQ